MALINSNNHACEIIIKMAKTIIPNGFQARPLFFFFFFETRAPGFEHQTMRVVAEKPRGEPEAIDH